MNNETLIKFLRDIYLKDNKTVLTDEDVKQIEKFYKDNYKNVETFDEFLKINPTITRKIKKAKGVYAEIERQFNSKSALQPGTIIECVLAQTIANMYNLSRFVDSFHSYIRELPANVLPYLRAEENTLLCRYIYYDPNNYENFLIQYGNPTSYDADLFLNNHIVKLEFKDRLARAGERDIKQYDENGKLLMDNDFLRDNPEYIPLINQFNEQTDIFSRYSPECDNVNYNDFDEDTKKDILRSYFTNLGIDTLVTLDKDNELLAITIDCVDGTDNFDIISTDGSEIRPAGKNSGKVFTLIFLNNSIINIGGDINDNRASVPIENMQNRIGRGTGGDITGKKINNLLFVTIEKIKQEDDRYLFNLGDVKQLKPTIAIHVKIIADKGKLKEYYSEILNND